MSRSLTTVFFLLSATSLAVAIIDSCKTVTQNMSLAVLSFFEEKNINWWRTSPESPDLNPIENLWHELKEYLRAKVKPRNLAELKTGMKAFWLTVSPQKCLKYIRHLDKVSPESLNYREKQLGTKSIYLGLTILFLILHSGLLEQNITWVYKCCFNSILVCH